jgi:hypothetical protein
MRVFHLVLKIVLLGALDSSRNLTAQLQTENDRLQHMADNLGEQIKDHRAWGGVRSGLKERPKMP